MILLLSHPVRDHLFQCYVSLQNKIADLCGSDCPALIAKGYEILLCLFPLSVVMIFTLHCHSAIILGFFFFFSFFFWNHFQHSYRLSSCIRNQLTAKTETEKKEEPLFENHALQSIFFTDEALVAAGDIHVNHLGQKKVCLFISSKPLVLCLDHCRFLFWISHSFNVNSVIFLQECYVSFIHA